MDLRWRGCGGGGGVDPQLRSGAAGFKAATTAVSRLCGYFSGEGLSGSGVSSPVSSNSALAPREPQHGRSVRRVTDAWLRSSDWT